MTTAPNLAGLVDAESVLGDALVLTVTAPDDPDYEDLLVCHRIVGATAWTQVVPLAAPARGESAAITLDGLTSGRMIEVLAVSRDAEGAPSLPSLTRRARPTTGEGPISARVEAALVAALETVVADVEVWRYEQDVTDKPGLFAVLVSQSIDQEDEGEVGTDGLVLATLEILILIARNGRDGTDEWMRRQAHDMLASCQAALLEDRTLGGLARDVRPSPQTLVPSPELKVADTVALARYQVLYRTLRADPYTPGP